MLHRLVLLALLFALCAGRCAADGGIVPYEFSLDATAHSSDQRAVLIHDAAAGTETMLLSTRYVGIPDDFAWIIPVPNLPAAADVGTVENGEWALDWLSSYTAPRAVVEQHGGVGGCAGCVPMMAAGGGSSADTAQAGVEVVDRLQVSGVDISLLNATSSAELAAWLSGNGYRFPAEGAAVLQHYVSKAWGFVAVRMDVPQTRLPPLEMVNAYFPNEPLRIRFATGQLVFPMRISAVSAGPEGAGVLLYVLADHRIQCETNPTREMLTPSGPFGSSEEFESAYNRVFDSLLAQTGARPLVVEYAAPQRAEYMPPALSGLLPAGSECFLTRLRTRFRPEDMTGDLTFAPAAFDSSYQVMAAAPVGPRLVGPALILALAALTLACRTGRIGRRLALHEALFIGALAACALL